MLTVAFQFHSTMEKCYPLYPRENDFLNHVLGLQRGDSNWELVSRFAIEKQQLEVTSYA